MPFKKYITDSPLAFFHASYRRMRPARGGNAKPEIPLIVQTDRRSIHNIYFFLQSMKMKKKKIKAKTFPLVFFPFFFLVLTDLRALYWLFLVKVSTENVSMKREVADLVSIMIRMRISACCYFLCRSVLWFLHV